METPICLVEHLTGQPFRESIFRQIILESSTYSKDWEGNWAPFLTQPSLTSRLARSEVAAGVDSPTVPSVSFQRPVQSARNSAL